MLYCRWYVQHMVLRTRCTVDQCIFDNSHSKIRHLDGENHQSHRYLKLLVNHYLHTSK